MCHLPKRGPTVTYPRERNVQTMACIARAKKEAETFFEKKANKPRAFHLYWEYALRRASDDSFRLMAGSEREVMVGSLDKVLDRAADLLLLQKWWRDP